MYVVQFLSSLPQVAPAGTAEIPLAKQVGQGVSAATQGYSFTLGI